MKVITTIIFTLALATSTKATAPVWYYFEGLQVMASDSTCAPWVLYYNLGHDEGELEGYFQVDGCLHESVTVGDNTFTLALNTKTNIAVITEDKTGLTTPGGVGSFVKKKAEGHGGPTFTCFYGEGPSTKNEVYVPHCW